MNGYTYLQVTGQDTIGLDATNNTLTVAGISGISVTTNTATNTLSFSTGGNLPNLLVTNSLTVNPATIGSINNVIIGATNPKAGTFTSLTATGAISFSPANANVTISPTGTGSVTINPATTGSINNTNIGSSIPATGAFTTLSANGIVNFNSNNANITISPTGSGVLTIGSGAPGNIDNVSVGATTASTGRFTTVSMTGAPGGATSAVTIGYASVLAAAFGMIMC
jgi:hypothetical protein